jgi:phosphoribosylformylglycinamidine synthase
VRVESTDSPFTQGLSKGEVLQIPIGHMEGNYFCDDRTLRDLQQQDRVLFRYATPEGEITRAANPNGSIDNIAGICNEGRNVLGMMPHPERASEPELGMTQGFRIFESMVGAMAKR